MGEGKPQPGCEVGGGAPCDSHSLLTIVSVAAAAAAAATTASSPPPGRGSLPAWENRLV